MFSINPCSAGDIASTVVKEFGTDAKRKAVFTEQLTWSGENGKNLLHSIGYVNQALVIRRRYCDRDGYEMAGMCSTKDWRPHYGRGIDIRLRRQTSAGQRCISRRLVPSIVNGARRWHM